MGTPQEAIFLGIVTALAIHLVVQMLTRLADSAARWSAAPPARSDPYEGHPHLAGDRWG